jgi:hypothetical protein
MTADQQVLEIVAIVLDHVQFHAQMGAAEARQDVGQHIARDKAGDAQ